VFRIYINFQDITSEKKSEIIQYFVNCKDAWAVVSGKGEVDFGVLFWIKDVSAFYQFWNKTAGKFGRFFGKTTISTLNHVIAYRKSFLLPDDFNKMDAKFYHLGSVGKTYQIDEIDYKLINELAVNARIPILELADKIGCSSQTVKLRVKNLMKNGIILKFRVAIDISKIGLQNYLINIHLKDYTKRKTILDYLEGKPWLEYVDDNVGWSDLQFEIVVKNVEKLTGIMDEINSKFEDAIKKQSFEIITERHKERWLPELY
jgi:DNA-binding Lrp family transcriptional regulator